ncbi:MAG: hypothetical protein QXR26_04075 [Candidatus Caldarchaeum sp.]
MMSLHRKAAKKFFHKPHVGTVKSIEGITVLRLAETLHNILKSLNMDYEYSVENDGNRYTLDFVASFRQRSPMQLWIYAYESYIGCVVEIKVYHELELSAEADEVLSRLVDRIDAAL